MKYDDEVLLDVSQLERQWDKRYTRTEINWGQSNAIAAKAYKKHHLEEYGVSLPVVERMTGEAITQADKYVSHYHGICGVHDIIDAIGVYLHSDIDTCLAWEQEEFVKALAVLDRRCGKRCLEKYASWSYTGYPEWLRRIIQVQFEAEGIRYHKHYAVKSK